MWGKRESLAANDKDFLTAQNDDTGADSLLVTSH